MDGIRQYILSVICVVTICGVAQMILQGGTAGALLKLVTGLLVTVTVISPLLKEQFLSWDIRLDSVLTNGNLAVNEGEEMAADAISEIITEKTQAYIMTKASQLGADVTVEVGLQTEPPYAPAEVSLFGAVSPYAREQLAVYIYEELGISEENQRWTS